MKYYFVQADSRTTRSVLPCGNVDAVELLAHFRTAVRQWDHGMVELVNDPDGGDVPLADALHFVDSFLILSDSAKKVVSSIATNAIEWIPAEYRNRSWWCLHSLDFVDAILEERSLLRRTSRGKVMEIEHLVLNATRVHGRTIFKLTGGLESYPPVVSHVFLDAWHSAGLNGLLFGQIAIS